MKTIKNIILSGVTIVILFLSTTSTAELITMNINGEVRDIYNTTSYSQSTFFTGDLISGTYTIETSTPASDVLSNRTNYRGALSSLDIVIGSYNITMTGGTTSNEYVTVFNKDPGAGDDRIQFTSYGTNPVLQQQTGNLTGLPFGGFSSPVYVQFYYIDSTGTAFSDESLPQEALDLTKFDATQRSTSFVLTFRTQDDPYNGGVLAVNGMLTGTGPAVVPEPIGSILFVTGGTLLAGRRIIRRRS